VYVSSFGVGEVFVFLSAFLLQALRVMMVSKKMSFFISFLNISYARQITMLIYRQGRLSKKSMAV
jgi:hypothetical protein